MTTLLVLGGCRSGKSRYAQERCEAISGGSLAYIATAQAFDVEMEERIARHRSERGSRWLTIDAPMDLAEALSEAAGRADAILVDCLTLWLSNLMLAEADIAAARAALADAVVACPIPVTLVANEVGLGIVPDNALARRFRDEAGWLNQQMATLCREVILLAAGLPLTLKA
ncbi:bifunctional adenosylcobinamide kinase/adenosylcobinamide-phosphate guanylyltransferase (plasmid) [Sphingobium sp. SJ10-10]|uniref:bifunctional adenosylcobinamide kinase/adenosylcobinamide-phosphate guanylyltransferase n=1 Tax=Sphingobium sp. SJ10-10 TaxID=3114999 RepID=UPI002E170EA5|nr:bifunctional adenosylcobinamide kinase/adenosylcobinamide-phosphate guanylyltransferase [Sphingobium sp. SJ10-10]